ncbi:PTS mannose/fructose/sorbose transporter subunit IIB [Acidilutibacter cellobiosedens]|uniref:PTS mannose/fructose/sorbose transporter subunit IIB n=1 Tax=Acidilutibacter cellobiosedens TaxID=2507161 RepID=A0A410QG26_9FIRM|nr:PTS sugar transporter subunit IIB [Acidilutibacter cellobiosedens]QAT63052.1 PTS mannose/fructose/sorbose transporter subunit IIB [Acidilutibacter cellobiosedens]HBN05152.1 PTS mannose/fructose/sorbose transporter subunit IIB [Bacteroidales bacterium]
MSIKIVRIDDRLIHGQVVTTWVKQYGIEQIIIVNDLIARDQVQMAVMQLAGPTGVKIVPLTVEKFINAYNSNPIKRSTMLIFTNPADVEKTLEGGVKIPFLNVGGMKFISGKTWITKAVSIDESDKNAFKKIMERGIDVQIQMLPNDKQISMKKLIK